MKRKYIYILCMGLLSLGIASVYVFEATRETRDLKAVEAHAGGEGEADQIATLETLFVKDAVIAGPDIVECTLSGGESADCFKITVRTAPVDFEPGPWCPRHVDDGADDGGLWIKDGEVYDVDGPFIKNLATLYDDDVWQMYNAETGEVYYTETAEACAAAARPDVDPQYYNHCVECRPEFMGDGASMTYTIPLQPVNLERVDSRPAGGIGLSFSGAKIETAAPLHAILGAHTLAAFDDCGGHVNLHVGYHIHAVTGCVKEIASDVENHASMIGYAMDGYPLYMKDNQDGQEPTDLDECRGHDVDGLGYHYHVADPGTNEILPCLKAQSGCSSNDADATCDASIRRGPPR